MFTLISLTVADDPGTWAAMGFTVADATVRIGSLDLVLTGADVVAASDVADVVKRGITGWTFASADKCPSEIDGIAVTQAPPGVDREVSVALTHPNGVCAIDHLVVSTPNLDRTIAAFEQAGLECRRERERTYDDNPRNTMRQAFFWLGDVSKPSERILCEVVGPKVPDPTKSNRPSSFFGLALTSEDIDFTATAMGDLLKPPVTAVQAGRRIATVRSSAGSSVPIAIMSPHINPLYVDPSSVNPSSAHHSSVPEQT